jgi:shikimate dehydrogenase
MPANYKAELVGVFGHPVAENPTCVMQEAASAAAKLNFRYLTIEVLPHDLPDAIRGLRAMNFRGINLTIPHKVAVIPLLDQIMPDAAMIGAVNTVRREGSGAGGGGKLIGENTDGKGFIRGLREDAHLDPAGKNVIILGAGGAARAIAVELALAHAASITVINRSVGRGQSMVHDLVARTCAHATFHPWTSTYRPPRDTDILVNATSIGLFPDTHSPDVSLDDLPPHALVCDVIPNPPNTPFLESARRRDLKTLDGLAMLVYQGAIAFKMWTGHEPHEPAMKSALRHAFNLPA